MDYTLDEIDSGTCNGIAPVNYLQGVTRLGFIAIDVGIRNMGIVVLHGNGVTEFHNASFGENEKCYEKLYSEPLAVLRQIADYFESLLLRMKSHASDIVLCIEQQVGHGYSYTANAYWEGVISTCIWTGMKRIFGNTGDFHLFRVSAQSARKRVLNVGRKPIKPIVLSSLLVTWGFVYRDLDTCIEDDSQWSQLKISADPKLAVLNILKHLISIVNPEMIRIKKKSKVCKFSPEVVGFLRSIPLPSPGGVITSHIADAWCILMYHLLEVAYKSHPGDSESTITPEESINLSDSAEDDMGCTENDINNEIDEWFI